MRKDGSQMDRTVYLFLEQLLNYIDEAKKYGYSKFIIDRDLKEMIYEFYDKAFDEGYSSHVEEQQDSDESEYDDGYADGYDSGKDDGKKYGAIAVYNFVKDFMEWDEEGIQTAIKKMIETKYNIEVKE